jgi:hypothetical protein
MQYDFLNKGYSTTIRYQSDDIEISFGRCNCYKDNENVVILVLKKLKIRIVGGSDLFDMFSKDSDGIIDKETLKLPPSHFVDLALTYLLKKVTSSELIKTLINQTAKIAFIQGKNKIRRQMRKLLKAELEPYF